MFRFGVVPMFLFSGTFFPISQFPEWIQPVAWLTPLWHGVELARGMSLGMETVFPMWVSLSYLAAWLGVGFWLADIKIRERLVA